MEVPEPSQPVEKPGSSSSISWLKHPWLVLIFGSVIALGLWMGIGLWIEHQRYLILQDVKRHPGINLTPSGNERFPVWLPHWIGKQLPPKWGLAISTHYGVGISDTASDEDLMLLNRQADFVGEITFWGDANGISDDALLQFIQEQPLWELAFWKGRRLQPKHLDALSEKPEFQTLIGIQGPLNQTVVDALGKLTNLENLWIDGPIQAGVSTRSLTKLTALDLLDWGASEIADEQFLNIAGLPALRSVYIRQTNLTSKSWSLLKSTNLHRVELESPDIDDTTGRFLAHNRSLFEICLRGGVLTDEGVEELLKLPDLSAIEIDARHLTIASAHRLSALPELDRVKLKGGANITDEWIAQLAHKEFSRFEVSNSAITDDGVALLKNNPPGVSLSLPGSRISDRSIDALSVMGLYQLDVRNTNISYTGLKRLVFDGYLHIGGTPVTPQGVAEFLSRNPEAVVHGIKGIQPDAEFDWLIPLD